MLGDRKEKEGVLAPTKLDRELDKIEWNVKDKGGRREQSQVGGLGLFNLVFDEA